MLKRKLEESLEADFQNEQDESNDDPIVILSPYFATPIWKLFFDLECELNQTLKKLDPPENIKYTYNPVEYAAELHLAYLRRYLDKPKSLVFIGMNPGPNGMGQTGIPFGNIKTVQDLMRLKGEVKQPPKVHPKRPVKGLNCTIEEPSGVRIWTLFDRLAGSLKNFSRRCFVHNFCPLAFFDAAGKSITPSELRGNYKQEIRDACLYTFYKQLDLLKPEVIVAVGDYVFTCLKDYKRVRVLKMPHPSPRSLNNTNWPEKAEKWLKDNDLIKFITKKVQE